MMEMINLEKLKIKFVINKFLLKDNSIVKNLKILKKYLNLLFIAKQEPRVYKVITKSTIS